MRGNHLGTDRESIHQPHRDARRGTASHVESPARIAGDDARLVLIVAVGNSQRRPRGRTIETTRRNDLTIDSITNR